MDSFSKPNQAKRSLILIFTAVFLASSLFLAPANASYGRMHKAIELLTQAQGAAFGSSQQLDLLNSALKNLHDAFAQGDDKKQAIASVESAIADLKKKDSAKLKEDITQAIAAANKVIPSTQDSTAAPQPPEPAVTGAVASSPPASAAPTAKLTEDQAKAVVLIKGDNAEGTGFLVKTPDGPAVVTNIHVISNNPNLKITTTTGAPVTILSYKGATDRDLAMIAIKDGSFSYLTLATDVSGTVQTGDEVITPGNSEGGEVMLNTDGKVMGLGPDRVEFDNPIYHGNSGGPVFHVKSGKVIGVVTEAVKVDVSDDLDKASFANRDSAIRNSMRYFGFRLDTTPSWETLDLQRFQTQTAFLDQFDKRSRCLDSYINAATSTSSNPTPAPSDNGKKHKKKKKKDEPAAPATPDTNNDAAATLYLSDPKIVQANNSYFEQARGADTSQQMNALQILVGELNNLADTDMDAIQNPKNFYGFNEMRAKDEIAYREAIKKELSEIRDNVGRLNSLPRTNN